MVADPDRMVEHWPSACGGCGAAIDTADRACEGEPVRHQVSEIVARIEITAHRRMRVRCRCGRCTLAELPAGVPAGAFGPAVAAAAATLTAARLSRRETARLLGDLCGVQISAASVEGLLKQASDTLENPYVEVLAALDDSAVRDSDDDLLAHAGLLLGYPATLGPAGAAVIRSVPAEISAEVRAPATVRFRRAHTLRGRECPRSPTAFPRGGRDAG